MPDDGQELECHPVSVPPSPSSVAGSVHGHALSHVTYSPSRCNPLHHSSLDISHRHGLPIMDCGMRLHALACQNAQGCTGHESGVCPTPVWSLKYLEVLNCCVAQRRHPT